MALPEARADINDHPKIIPAPTVHVWFQSLTAVETQPQAHVFYSTRSKTVEGSDDVLEGNAENVSITWRQH
jgi:hypothetical protein